jgi:hypothetical protein
MTLSLFGKVVKFFEKLLEIFGLHHISNIINADSRFTFEVEAVLLIWDLLGAFFQI